MSALPSEHSSDGVAAEEVWYIPGVFDLLECWAALESRSPPLSSDVVSAEEVRDFPGVFGLTVWWSSPGATGFIGDGWSWSAVCSVETSDGVTTECLSSCSKPSKDGLRGGESWMLGFSGIKGDG